MKQIVLERPSSPAGSSIRSNPNGTVTLRKPGWGSHRILKCLVCAHISSDELRLGFQRSACRRGRFGTSAGDPRQYSNHELQFPSRELLAIAKACTDYQPQEATS